MKSEDPNAKTIITTMVIFVLIAVICEITKEWFTKWLNYKFKPWYRSKF